MTFSRTAALLLGTALSTQPLLADTDTSAPAAAPEAADAEQEIVEIVVTGQKRDRSIIETQDSVIVFDEETVKATTFTEFVDLFRFAPNVSQTDSGEGVFSIRGVSAIGGIGFAGVANTSALYVDGVFQSNLGIEGGPAALFDIDQVEIYRGPQTTLQGRNALFGAVVVNTRNPTYEWDAKGRLEYSEFDTQRYSLALGGPIIADKLAFRVAADYRETDGFITNAVTNRDTIDADEALNVRAKLLAEPTEDLSILATYTYSEGDASTGFGTGAVQGPDFFDRIVSIDNPTLQSITTHSGIIRLDYQINDQLTITSETAYTDASERSGPRFDTTEFPVNGFLDLGGDSEEIFTSDLRLSYASDALDLLVGAYYFDRDRAFDRDLSGRIVVVPGVIETDLSLISGGGSETENYALYADGAYHLTDQWSILFGARYDEEDLAIDQFNQTTFIPELPDIGFVNAPGAQLLADTSFSAFLPKLGVQYAIAEDQRLAFVVQRGYRPGGAGIALSGDQFAFEPEFLWNYELSYRSLWLDKRLAVNANVFLADWNDQQVVVGLGVNAQTDNVGESRLWGFEGEVRFAATDALTVFTTFGYNNTEISSVSPDVPGGAALVGNEFPQASDLQISAGSIYRHETGFFASLDGSYTSGAFSNIENLEANRLDDYIVVNAKLGYEQENWALYGFVRNAFDEDYAFRIDVNDFRSGGQGTATIGAPQVFGLELTFDF